jgi:hypothetical protein
MPNGAGSIRPALRWPLDGQKQHRGSCIGGARSRRPSTGGLNRRREVSSSWRSADTTWQRWSSPVAERRPSNAYPECWLPTKRVRPKTLLRYHKLVLNNATLMLGLISLPGLDCRHVSRLLGRISRALSPPAPATTYEQFFAILSTTRSRRRWNSGPSRPMPSWLGRNITEWHLSTSCLRRRSGSGTPSLRSHALAVRARPGWQFQRGGPNAGSAASSARRRPAHSPSAVAAHASPMRRPAVPSTTHSECQRVLRLVASNRESWAADRAVISF